jgi:hypothetical protein
MPSFLHTYEYRVPAERCHTRHRAIRHNPESANRVMMTMTFTEVSEVASEEPGSCPRTGGSPPERIPSSGGACSIGRRSVLHRQEERAPSAGGACSVGRRSVLRRGVELEALRIRHAVCSPSSPEKGAEEEVRDKLHLSYIWRGRTKKNKFFLASAERLHYLCVELPN